MNTNRLLFDFRPILLVTGILLATLGLAMLIPAMVDLAFGNRDWQVFASAALVTILTGLSFFTTVRGTVTDFSLREAFILTVLIWIILPAFAAIPFLWSGMTPHYSDAFFEAISGLTTTGATVLVGLDNAPPGILLWRGILQWLGGLGIIVMAVAILPILQVGGMQLFKVEAFDTRDKILPRATQISSSITAVYIIFTIICALAYMIAGMTVMDAIIHAMTTLSTGGFSSKDASMGYFASPLIDTIAIIFMIIGSLPFVLYVQIARGQPVAFWKDEQIRLFFILLITFILAVFFFKVSNNISTGWTALRDAAFNITSIMTGTGYATEDYHAWGPFSSASFFVVMFIGGCAGSTSCGMKTFRILVLAKTLAQNISHLSYPHGIFSMTFNGRRLTDSVVVSVMNFFFLYLAIFALLSAALAATGLDPVTALSGAATAISNVGPGLGDIIGPDGNFSPLNTTAKWLLCFGMLLGRLELFTVLVLFVPRFWRD